MKTINPFNPNSIVPPNLFAGRKQAVLDIIKKLAQVKNGMPASFFLYGDRGIGKTALARLIKYVAEINDNDFGNLNFLTSYYSVGKNQFISSVLQASLNELTDIMPGNIIMKLGQRLGGILKNGKFSIGAFSLELRDTEETVALKDLIVSILSNVISELKLDGQKDGVLMVIDELDNVADIEQCAQLFRGIATTLNFKGIGNISFLLIGYSQTEEKFFSGDQSARRQFDITRLGTMPGTEAMEVLEKGFTQINLKWDKNALFENIFVTGGYPHSIQMIGYHLVEVDNDDFINQEDWEAAIDNTAKDLITKDFAALYDFNGRPGVRELILDILSLRGASSKKQLMEYSGGKNIYQYIPDLIKRGSIRENKSTDSLSLHSRLFRAAILMHIAFRIRHEGYLKELIKEVAAQSKDAQSLIPESPQDVS